MQGQLKEALETLCRHSVTVYGAGRTDAGVHAWGQVASFRTQADLSCRRLLRGLNGLCGEGLRAVSVDDVPDEFHPRRSAVGKVYAYRLLLRSAPSALMKGRAWHQPLALDLDRMEAELGSLLGEADWSAYRASDCSSPSPVKELRRVEVLREPRDVVALVFEGSGFLKQMVRVLVGTAVEVGLGKRPEGDMLALRTGGDRRRAGVTAPACGLYLERVLYPG